MQVGLKASNVDVQNKLANWGYDDVWRLIWMTLIFCILTPLSRSVWALKKNFSLAMWLHIVSGGLYQGRLSASIAPGNFIGECVRTLSIALG